MLSSKSHVVNHQLLKQSIHYLLLQPFTDISLWLLNPFISTKAKVISFASIFTVQNIFPSNSYSIFTLYPHSKPLLDIYPFITKSNLIISSNIIPLLLYIAFCHLHFHLFTKTTLCLWYLVTTKYFPFIIHSLLIYSPTFYNTYHILHFCLPFQVVFLQIINNLPLIITENLCLIISIDYKINSDISFQNYTSPTIQYILPLRLNYIISQISFLYCYLSLCPLVYVSLLLVIPDEIFYLLFLQFRFYRNIAAQNKIKTL